MGRPNPALRRGFSKINSNYNGESMTIAGTVNKTFMLLSIALITASFTWTRFFSTARYFESIQNWMIGGIIGALILGLLTAFIPKLARVTAPLYALSEGLFIGGFSALLESMYPGIVIQAISLTFTVFLGMLFLYKFQIIKATKKFKAGVLSATFGILLVYLLNFVLSFFGVKMTMLHDSGLISIGFSLFVILIAALNLIIDFDFIEKVTLNGAPKYMEWFAAYGLMVTLVWLYIRILDLLSKLNSRD